MGRRVGEGQASGFGFFLLPPKWQQPFLGSAVSSGQRTGLCTSAAGGLSSLPLPAPNPLHGQVKAVPYKAELLDAALLSLLAHPSGVRPPNAFSLFQGGNSSFTPSPAAPAMDRHPDQFGNDQKPSTAWPWPDGLCFHHISREVDTTKTTLVTGTFNPKAKDRMYFKIKC